MWSALKSPLEKAIGSWRGGKVEILVLLSVVAKKRKNILELPMLYFKGNVQLCVWASPWDKVTQRCCRRAGGHEAACGQVAKKAKGMLACVSKSGAAGAGQWPVPCAGQRCGRSWSAVWS